MIKKNEELVFKGLNLSNNVTNKEEFQSDIQKHGNFLQIIHIVSKYAYYCYLGIGILYIIDIVYQKYLEPKKKEI